MLRGPCPVLLLLIVLLAAVFPGTQTEEEDLSVKKSADNPSGPPRVRLSVRELSKNSTKVNALLRAWKRIQALPADNPNSFWVIGGFHGEPFIPSKIPLKDGEKYWGGWCQHRNVLFPAWHRFYMLRFEQALRTVSPEDDVTLPYWDHTSEATQKEGIPKLLTDELVEIDGKMEPNPLRSFTLPKALGWAGGRADLYYAKPRGYETVRYPFSGIKSPEQAKLVADAHNAKMAKLLPNAESATAALNAYIKTWLNQGNPLYYHPNSIFSHFKKSLDASNYNTFSNVKSAGEKLEVSVEQPHNAIHYAIGGFDMHGQDLGYIPGSNGDMGIFEMAGFDPIFYFHHANIDRMFWVWQKKQGFTDNLEIDPNDKVGTNPSRGQGPTPGQVPNQQLTMDTPLHPFQTLIGVAATSRDCINIEKQLGYTYSIGSLDEPEHPKPATHKVEYITVTNPEEITTKLREADQQTTPPRLVFDVTSINTCNSPGQTKGLPFNDSNEQPQPFQVPSSRFDWVSSYMLKVHGIDGNMYNGSFLVRAYYQTGGKPHFIGQRAFFGRSGQNLCKDCQMNRVDSVFDLPLINLTLPLHVKDFKVKVVSKSLDSGSDVTTDLRLAARCGGASKEGRASEPYLTFYKVFTAKPKTA